MQRLHYLEISWAYIVSAVVLPVIYLLPALGLFLNTPVIRYEQTYYFLRLPSLAAQLLLYYVVSGRSFATTRFWGSLCFLYARSLWWSIFYRTRPYTVTAKSKKAQPNLILILPHISYIIINIVAVVWRISVDGYVSSAVWSGQVWTVLMVYWFTPVLQKGLGLAGATNNSTRVKLSFSFQPSGLTIDKRVKAQ